MPAPPIIEPVAADAEPGAEEVGTAKLLLLLLLLFVFPLGWA